jgi:Flp pilus assembly protein TadG
VSSSHQRDESGVVAVVAAVLVTLLFAVAALGVDLGNAMDRRQKVQTQADFAALAGGAELPAASLTPLATDPEVLAVARYLINNDVLDDGTRKLDLKGMTETTLAAKLVSNSAADQAAYGHVYYGRFNSSGQLVPSLNHLTVTTPGKKISFGLASAVGFSDVTVTGRATAGIFSRGAIASLPFYAYDGCDWGQQIISHSTSNASAPNLFTGTDWGTGNWNGRPTLTAPTPLAPNSSPQQVAVNSDSTMLTLRGTNLSLWDNSPNGEGVTAVGFFLPDGTAPHVIPRSQITVVSPTEIRVPATVSSLPDANGKTFYIRIQYRARQGSNYNLHGSDIATTMAYTDVGDATLFCNDQKNSGNFGSLTIHRTDSNNSANNGWLPLNIALGIDVPQVNLTTYKATITTSSCGNGDSNAIFSDTKSAEINCLITDTGFPQNPATAGFIQGVGAVPGRLKKIDSGCGGATVGKPPIRSVQVHGTHQINNEVLTCYFTDNATTVAQVSNKNYSGAAVIDDDIYTSPRFFFVPVVNKQPSNGKKAFPIIDFRPAFMTGQMGAATKLNPHVYYDDATTNGLEVAQNSVQSFRVVFINPTALPPLPGAGSLLDYTGSGPKQLLLID